MLLPQLPTAAGIGQILGPDERVLITGRGSNLRRWAASRLGAGKPPRPGVRPPTDLSPVATAVRFAPTTSPFHQRLVFERFMSESVPVGARRDLKPPGYLHLDPSDRFPRLTVSSGAAQQRGFGPFKDRAAASRARDVLNKRFPLRPCDYVFEPDPELPLGLGCVYAQVRSCAAPCLGRVAESGYRDLAARVAAFLGGERPAAEASVPSWIASIEGSCGLVLERGKAGLELYPVRDGAVLDESALCLADVQDLPGALASLAWPRPEPLRDDLAWLSAWLHAPRRSGQYLVAQEPAALLPSVLALVGLG